MLVVRVNEDCLPLSCGFEGGEADEAERMAEERQTRHHSPYCLRHSPACCHSPWWSWRGRGVRGRGVGGCLALGGGRVLLADEQLSLAA